MVFPPSFPLPNSFQYHGYVRPITNYLKTFSETPLPPMGKPNLLREGPNSVTVSWYGPSYDGGCVVTDYKLEMQVNCMVL